MTSQSKIFAAKSLLQQYCQDVRQFIGQGHNPHYFDSVFVTESIITFAPILHSKYGFGANMYGEDFVALHQALCANLINKVEA